MERIKNGVVLRPTKQQLPLDQVGKDLGGKCSWEAAGLGSSHRAGRAQPHLCPPVPQDLVAGKRRSTVLELQNILVSILVPRQGDTRGRGDSLPSCSHPAWSCTGALLAGLKAGVPEPGCDPSAPGFAQGAMRRASRRASGRQSSLKGRDKQLESILQRRRRAVDATTPSLPTLSPTLRPPPQDQEGAGAARSPDPGRERGEVWFWAG